MPASLLGLLVLRACWNSEEGGKAKPETPAEKEHFDFLYQRHLCASSLMLPSIPDRRPVASSLNRRRDTTHRGWQEPASSSEPCSIFPTGYFFGHLPSPQVSPSPTSVHLQVTSVSTQACTLTRADAFALLQPPNSFLFQILPHYLTPQRYNLAPFTSSVRFHHAICISLSYYLLFHTEFSSQEMYELSNIHERAL